MSSSCLKSWGSIILVDPSHWFWEALLQGCCSDAQETELGAGMTFNLKS
jgi:hypothetical protein